MRDDDDYPGPWMVRPTRLEVLIIVAIIVGMLALCSTPVG